MRKWLSLVLLISMLSVHGYYTFRDSGAVAVQHFMGENLCPVESATHVAIVSGSWQDASTWANGTVPTDGARVRIPCNCWVTNHATTAKLQWIHVEGVLDVCDHCTTLFRTHTIYIPMLGRMMVGTSSMPIAPDVTAGIEFLSGPEVGLAGDYLPGDWQILSCGLVCHGEFKACGAARTPWVEADATLAANTTQISVLRDVDWKVGDEVLVAGTDAVALPDLSDVTTHRYQSQLAKIASVINSKTFTIDTQLKYPRKPWGTGLKYHVANLTRNVVFRSSDPANVKHRGHMMFMSSMNDIRYAKQLNLGRTDKSRPVTDPRLDAISGVVIAGSQDNPRARYPDHNHRNGALSAASYRYATVIDGSPGWGGVNHASNMNWVYGICLRCYGSGFTTEEGQERGKFDWCLAALCRGDGDKPGISGDDDHGRQGIGDWGTDGSGFWLQGGMVAVTNCVSFDHSGRSYALFNQPLNSYPRYGGDPAIVPWIQFSITIDPSLVGSEYDKTKPIPSSSVLQQVFSNNVGYNTKGLQAWSAQFARADGLPPGARANITNYTGYGRGSTLNLEYSPQVVVTGLRLEGDSLFRDQHVAGTNPGVPILLRSPTVSVTDYTINGIYKRNDWPKPKPISDIGTTAEKATHVVDGTYPIIDGNTGAKIR